MCGNIFIRQSRGNSMDSKLKISVIMPVYNAEETLIRSVQSAQHQTLKEIEIICVNDGSKDNSLKLLEELAKEDSRIRVLSQENSGAGPARNLALSKARGEFISFLDADDKYASDNALESLYVAAKRNGVLICGGNSRNIDRATNQLMPINSADKRWYKTEKVYEVRVRPNCYGYCQFIFDRKMLNQGKVRFPSLRRYQDPPFLLKAMIEAGKYCVIPTIVLAVYREEEHWNEKKLVDCLRGIRLVMKLSYEHNLLAVQNELVGSIHPIVDKDSRYFRRVFLYNLNCHNREAKKIMESTGKYVLDCVKKQYKIPDGNLYEEIIHQVYGIHWRRYYNLMKQYCVNIYKRMKE